MMTVMYNMKRKNIDIVLRKTIHLISTTKKKQNSIQTILFKAHQLTRLLVGKEKVTKYFCERLRGELRV